MKQKRIIYTLLILMLASLACNLPGVGTTATPTVDINTAIAQTLTAVQPPQPTQPAPSPTAAPLDSTATPVAAAPATLAPSPVPAASAAPLPTPCNAALFVADITIPDGTGVQAGTGFVKTWQLKNIGTCSWTSSYQLVFISGDAMSAPASVSMTAANIDPNGVVNVSVSLTAPAAPGNYTDYFKLRAPDGTIFGIGNSGNDAFWVKIASVSPGATAVPATPVPTATLGIIKIPVLTIIPILLLKPDLRVTNISIQPVPVHANAIQNIYVTIYNGGTLATSGSFPVKFWGYPGDPNPCGWVVTQSIAVGSGTVLHCTYTWNQAYLAGVNSTAVVNVGNAVVESNYNNNSYTIITVVH